MLLVLIALFYSLSAILLLTDYFSHVLIEEKYTDSWWQYLLIAFFSLIFIYYAYIVKKKQKKRDKHYIKFTAGLLFFILILYTIFNREIIVAAHLFSDKKPYLLKTQIVEVMSENVIRRGAWKKIRIKNYTKPFNTVYVFKGNRYLKLYQGETIYIYGLKSKFGFTYLDFRYEDDNKTLERNSLPCE